MMLIVVCFFFFNDTATTEIYTLSLHDALPISLRRRKSMVLDPADPNTRSAGSFFTNPVLSRSEEHTSELQSRLHLVCRLLLEKKKKQRRLHHVKAVSMMCCVRDVAGAYARPRY